MNNEANTHESSVKNNSSIIPVICISIVYLFLCAPFFPSGICVGDSGDIQMSSMTLGIAHPPGYSGYSFVGWSLITIFFWVEPPFVITVACHVSLIVSAVIAFKILQRLEVNQWLAAGLVLLPLFNRMVWINATTAEIYAPSLALLMGVVWQIFCFQKSHAKWNMVLASIMLGLLVGNRPPALFYVPAIVAGYLLIVCNKDRKEDADSAGKEFLSGILVSSAVTGCVIIKCILLLALRLWQDVPYNYVRQYTEAGAGEISDSTWGQVWWTISGQQFRDSMGANLLEMKRKFWLIRESFDLEWNILFVMVLALFASGLILLFKRDRLIALVVSFIFAGQMIFLLQYKLQGQVADRLPVVFTGLIIISCPLSSIVNRIGKNRAPLLGLGFFILISSLLYIERDRQPNYGKDSAFNLARYANELRMHLNYQKMR